MKMLFIQCICTTQASW